MRNHHRALHAETELAGRILLELAGREWWCGVAAAFFLIDGADDPISFFEANPNLLGFLAVRNLDFFFALANEARIECRRLRSGEVSIHRPVFFFLERFDLALAFDNQAESDGLHASGRETAANFIP